MRPVCVCVCVFDLVVCWVNTLHHYCRTQMLYFAVACYLEVDVLKTINNWTFLWILEHMASWYLASENNKIKTKKLKVAQSELTKLGNNSVAVQTLYEKITVIVKILLHCDFLAISIQKMQSKWNADFFPAERLNMPTLFVIVIIFNDEKNSSQKDKIKQYVLLFFGGCFFEQSVRTTWWRTCCSPFWGVSGSSLFGISTQSALKRTENIQSPERNTSNCIFCRVDMFRAWLKLKTH